MTRGQSSPSVQSPEEVAAELAERIFETGLGAFELVTITLGDRLGLYRALADRGPTTVSELAATVGTDPRYTREWCEQQAVAGLLDVDDAAGDIEERRFDLLPGSGAVFLDPQSPAYVMPLGGSWRLSAESSLPWRWRSVLARVCPTPTTRCNMRKQPSIAPPSPASSSRNGFPRFPISTRGWAPAAPSQRSVVARAGPRSRSPSATPACSSTPSTQTLRRSRRPSAMRRPQAWPTASVSPWRTLRILEWRTATTPYSLSKCCTISRTLSPRCVLPVGSPATVRHRRSSWTSGRPSCSARLGIRSSASSTRSACSTACRPVAPTRRPLRPARSSDLTSCADTRPRPGSPTSPCCRSRTTCSASTGWRAEPRVS